MCLLGMVELLCGLADAITCYCRLGQQLKVYWPKEHMRVEGVIDDHNQVDNDSHIYHIVYQDGNEQVAWPIALLCCCLHASIPACLRVNFKACHCEPVPLAPAGV